MVNGKKENLMDTQVVGMMLDEFYQKTQVMIGEAISVSELRKYIVENAAGLELDLTDLKSSETGKSTSKPR